MKESKLTLRSRLWVLSSMSLSLLPFLSPESCCRRAIILRLIVFGDSENLRESLVDPRPIPGSDSLPVSNCGSSSRFGLEESVTTI